MQGFSTAETFKKITNKISAVDETFKKITNKISAVDETFKKIAGKVSAVDETFKKIINKVSAVDETLKTIVGEGAVPKVVVIAGLTRNPKSKGILTFVRMTVSQSKFSQKTPLFINKQIIFIMNIEMIRLGNLRNSEHFQFHTEFCKLVKKIGVKPLKIQAQFDAYNLLFEQEDEAFQKIVKSAITAEIQNADRQRDLLFSGMATSCKAALKHFDEKVQNAAKRLKILFETYGNLAQKPLNEETADLYNLLQELNGAYLPDAKLVGITDWAQELQKSNDAFSKLMENRYEETALKTDLVLKTVRQQVDTAYREMVERINALAIVEGEKNYSEFIRNLNAIIEKYSAILAQRTKKKNLVADNSDSKF